MTTTTAPGASAAARRRLADALTSGGALAPGSPWYEAFASVPREVFAPEFTVSGPGGRRGFAPGDPGYLDAVYTDTTLITRRDGGGTATSSSSQPSLMARMLEAFAVPDGARVLEIGTGTGYNTALLCHRLGADRVTTIDVEPELTATARERLTESGNAPLVITGDGTAGYAEVAPYDGILATCGVNRIPTAWLHQVRPGGIIVTNTGNGIAVLTVDEEGNADGGFLPGDAVFMRARPGVGHITPTASQFTELLLGGDGRSRTVDLPATDDTAAFLTAVVHATAHEIWMVQPDVVAMTLVGADNGLDIYGLVHPPTASWARITPGHGARATVVHGGPRDLWSPRLALTTQWIAAGRPGPGPYTLSITATGGHTLRRTGTSPATWTL
ncbi:methyltransferase domain-containing protein [Streptomyces sp. NPDC000594]|uniref:methyltransferase domain-containing protein n=1 Tax=Streptomyces sp. NPDC000594 TaxID=3154261 RepID=UPI003320CADD